MSDYLNFDSPDDELRDDEYPDEPVEDDETDTVPCPQCGEEVYEDSVRCPACGHYMVDSGHSLSGRPLWWLVLGFAGVLAAVLAVAALHCG